MDELFEFLFKYNRIVFEKGDFTFARQPSPLMMAALVAGVLGVAALAYVRPGTPLPWKWKGLLVALRSGALMILLFCVLQPVLIVPAVVPQTSYVAVLVDDSQSMTVRDVNGVSRSEAVTRLIVPHASFYKRLAEKFKLRFYRFSRQAEVVADPQAIRGSGSRTDLASALTSVTADFASLPLSALVVFTDGADHSMTDLSQVFSSLKARQVPLYVVGVGSQRLEADAELIRVNVPPRILKGSSVTADVLVRVGRRLNSRVAISVSEEGQVIASHEVDVKPSSEPQLVRLDFTPTRTGPLRYRFAINVQPQELIAENNKRDVVINVRDDVARILYIEGEPRWEYGKLRQALAEDPQVNLVSVVRTAQGKFYRQGIESGEELVEGFPRSREELFRYQGLILGNIEAGFFSFDQLKQIEAFVSERGGGLLMLGGDRSFSAGGYGLTPLADVLPVVLDKERPSARGADERVAAYAPVVTASGRIHPVTRLKREDGANLQAWRSLPPVTIPELFTEVKPGAVVLLEGQRGGGRERSVMLAFQRYGKGISFAFTPCDSWRWQMEMDAADLSHETFWRQLLRYLVSGAADQVMVSTDADAYDLLDEARLRIAVSDAGYAPLTDAQVETVVTTPSGTKMKVAAAATVHSGGYEASVPLTESGVYRVDVSARKGGETLGRAETVFSVGELHREFYQAQQNVELLKRMAAETGGRYYPLEDAERLPEEIAYIEGQNSIRVAREIWDMPITFLLLVGLVSAEWLLRKKKGLV